MNLDPITLEVIRNKLDGIANEMQFSLLRSAFSPIVKEGLDASSSLFTLKGETLSQSISIPIQLGTLIPIINQILKFNSNYTIDPWNQTRYFFYPSGIECFRNSNWKVTL